MKVVLNPQFAFLRDFVFCIPDTFDNTGDTIYKGRNELKVFSIQGVQVNVKKYKIPMFINRIVYTFFRPTKAERAYRNALEVRERGFETPEPIAYIEKKKRGLFSEGYYVSVQCPYIRNMREFGDKPLAGNEDILAEFARYTARLHENNILHLDYSPGNILFVKTAEGVRFSLLDINRMKFCFVNEEQGCHSFERLWGPEEMFHFLAGEYASARGFDVKNCQQKVLLYHRKCMEYFQNKAIIKQKLKEKDYRTCLRFWCANLRYLYFSN